MRLTTRSDQIDLPTARCILRPASTEPTQFDRTHSTRSSQWLCLPIYNTSTSSPYIRPAFTEPIPFDRIPSIGSSQWLLICSSCRSYLLNCSLCHGFLYYTTTVSRSNRIQPIQSSREWLLILSAPSLSTYNYRPDPF